MAAIDKSRSRSIRTWLAFACLLFLEVVAIRAQSPAASLTPALVVAGSPELIRVQATGATAIEGEWLGRKLEFFRGRDGRTWFALAGVDVEAPVGPSTLKIATQTATGTANLSQTVQIQPAHYRTGSLTVEPKFVEPDPEALKEIEAERLL